MPLCLLQSLLGFSDWFVPFLIILSHSLLLAFELINCGTRLGALLAPVSLATKMLASKLIHYFSSHPSAFGFQASTPPDNISLNSANRKADQSLLDIQTDVGATAHATLDTEQLISHLWVPLLILFPHCLRLRVMLYLCLKCVNYFSGFMTFWTRLFPSEVEIEHVF